MGTMHKLTSATTMPLISGINMTNGARILSDGNDCLEDIAVSINNIFNWFMPTIVLDLQIVNPWSCSNGEGEVTLGEYVVPAWTVGVGGSSARQYFLGYIKAGTTGTAVGTFKAYVGDVLAGQRTGISGAASTQITTGGSAALCDREIMVVKVTGEVTSGTGDLEVEEFRLEYDTFSPTLPDGPYGGDYVNEFLPIDTDHFGTDYYAGTVERVRRMLVSLMELIRRRTPQPIVTWSNYADPFTAGGAKQTGPFVLCRLLTDQLPYYKQAMVHVKYKSSEGIRAEIGDSFVNLPPVSLAGGWWGRAAIQVDYSDEPGFSTPEFKLTDLDPQGDAEIFSLSAYWGILE